MGYLITVSILILVYILGGCVSLTPSNKTRKLDASAWKAQSLAKRRITPYTIERFSPEDLEVTSRTNQPDKINGELKKELNIFKQEAPDALDLIAHERNKDREVWVYTSYRYDNYFYAPGYWVAVSENGRFFPARPYRQ